MSAYETMRVETRGAVEWVTLDRPESLNALDRVLIRELAEYFEGLATRTAVRVVVLRGAGKSFCAGLDLKDFASYMEALDTEGMMAAQRTVSRFILAMRRCPQPIVCLLHGSACGGGFALALASDIRLCTPDTRMNMAAIQIGLSGCDVGVSYLLPRLAGASIASELLLTGRFLHADRALALGLVAEVCAADALEARAERLVGELLNASPLGLSLTKLGLAVNAAAPSLESAIELEDRQQALLAHDALFRERVRAFAQRSRG